MSDTVRDPVCGMPFDRRRAAATAEVEGRTYHFCSPSCARRFRADPSRYTVGEPEGGRP